MPILLGMSEIQAAVETAGSQAALAQMVGVTQATVGEWVSGRRPVPRERCHEIERATNGAAVCERLRPDLAWLRVKDKAWPWHPEGRPALDVARAST